jgi:hypothetical protein
MAASNRPPIKKGIGRKFKSIADCIKKGIKRKTYDVVGEKMTDGN